MEFFFAMPATILVLEDSPTTLQFLALSLLQHGFKVLTAPDGVEGLLKLANNNVDLVVTDINMPRMDGLSFIRKVRSSPEYADLPILIVSTENESKNLRRADEAGADAYLVKPVSAQQLVQEVERLLKR